MDQNPTAKIYETVQTLGIVKNKKRQEFLCQLIEGLIKGRSVIFTEIADKIPSDIKAESMERKIQGFFEKASFDYLQLGVFLLSFVHHKQVVVSIDRTEWDFGKTQVNILSVVVSVGKMAVPIHFEMLDNKSGNSGATDRIALFKSLLGILGKERIEFVVMDREFIGNEWLSWLKKQGIGFCVRVPKSHLVSFLDGEVESAEELMEGRQSFVGRDVVVDGVVVNLSLSYGADGKLLYLIGTASPKELPRQYRRRWGIETFFQATKGRGFNIESSCLRCMEKYRKLFALVCIAYTICWAVGIQHGKANPVKRKKHGYPQYSVFRRGLNLMRKLYKDGDNQILIEAIMLAIERILPTKKSVG